MRRLSTALALIAAVALAGCVSLFPKSKPVQLYRFSAPATAPAAAPAAGPRIALLLPSVIFARAVGGDRILGVTGQQTAYIAEARWVSPATVLFDEAVTRVFEDNQGSARIVRRGEVARADLVLRLEVQTFEAVYDQGAKAAPEVRIRLRASATRASDRSLVAEQVFEAKTRAYDNRVGAIVTAFNEGVGKVLTDLVAWANGLPAAN